MSRRRSLLDKMQDIAEDQELDEAQSDEDDSHHNYAYYYDEELSDSRNESLSTEEKGESRLQTLDPLYEEAEDEKQVATADDASSYGPEGSQISQLSQEESGYSAYPVAKRRSHVTKRCSGTMSAPDTYHAGPQERRRSRRVTIHDSFSSRPSVRMQTLLQQPTSEDSQESSSSGRVSFFRRQRRTTRNAIAQQSLRIDPSVQLSMAAEQLSGDDPRNWENVAAAAAVVAASTQAPTTRGHIQFARGDRVLCMLTLLNITNRDEDKIEFTIDPVNSYGYPFGGGGTEAERQGPYNFVLCEVKNVHFDEDERYYTVVRLDCGSEQRADPGWMEPCDPGALEAAEQAAKNTLKANEEGKDHMFEGMNIWKRTWRDCWMLLTVPFSFFRSHVLPFYRETRRRARAFVSHLMFGDPGFGWNIQITGINFLVACSFTFLFLQPISLGFLSPKYDRSVAIANFCVWLVLVLELFLEVVICPSNYWQLVYSDKAYEPSTARNLNSFHLIFESIALMMYTPEIPCAFEGLACGDDIEAGLLWSSMRAVVGTSAGMVFLARFLFGLTFLRAFGLVRHWKQMWLSNNFAETEKLEKESQMSLDAIKKRNDDACSYAERSTQSIMSDESKKEVPKVEEVREGEDQDLKNAAFIGTALMLVNSHRALLLLIGVVAFFPAMFTLWQGNAYHHSDAAHLFTINRDFDDCDFLEASVVAWLNSNAFESPSMVENDDDIRLTLMYAQMLPVRCPWQSDDGVITNCGVDTQVQLAESRAALPPICNTWEKLANTSATRTALADVLGVRPGGLTDITRSEAEYYVRTVYDDNDAVRFTNASIVFLLFSMLVLAVVGLQVLRGDADRLVLKPLRRMLKIVIRYAENPLHQDSGTDKKGQVDPLKSVQDDDSVVDQSDLGNFETEQLINAITKIADLLRKCWGVAGAGIISSNLARTKGGTTVVFNPTVPGKRVYALFGFVGIKEFDRQLRALESDVMILINDVARIIHDEVYRWALGDSGQCNKNLGGAFLMVFRIGDFNEVHQKQKRATNVVFNSQNRNAKLRKQSRGKRRQRRVSSRHFEIGSNGTLQLASLPGIQTFTDRAVLGMLKSFASLHRDKAMQNWQKDFRLGAGVGAFTVEVLYGMDAGWAVEGAVGSEYKIDATYLSPHVNMASRMMSASKQYGVNILLSQAVEELMSKTARSKLRHLDTVYVKGSSVAQQIFTYDCRHEGVDFFLIERSLEQAEFDAEHYNPSIWQTDSDLRAMRQHVSKDFLRKFRFGVDRYIKGEWEDAIKILSEADNLMIRFVSDEGYVEVDIEDFGNELYDRSTTDEDIIRLRHSFGDGACRCLLSYMERRNGVPPKGWHGVRKLMSK